MQHDLTVIFHSYLSGFIFFFQSRMALAGVAAAAAAGFTIGVSLTFAAGLLLFLALTRNS